MSHQHIILCEGYDDRAFWAGWLRHMGLRDLSLRTDSTRDRRVMDPWGRPVVRGQFGFATPSGAFVRLVPCEGGDNVPPTAVQFIKEHTTHPIARLIVNLDADDTLSARSTSARDIIANLTRTHAKTGVSIVPIVWECADAATPGIPDKQTLERLVVSAIVAAYPQRGANVASWLAAEPRGGDSHKHHALSYLAKWYAENGPDDFYKELWLDPRTAPELELRLRHSGAWAEVEALAQS